MQSGFLVFTIMIMGLIPDLWGITPQYGGTFIYRAPDKVQILDPPRIEDNVSYNISGNIYEGLVRYQGESAIIEPSLATRWEVSKDGLYWTFFLRHEVVFHDNTKLNANAVLFSFMRQMDEHHPYYRDDFLYKDVIFSHVKSLSVLDEYTIQFELSKPFSPFLHLLTMPPARIVSPDAVMKNPDEFGLHPGGTGPFYVKEWTERDLVLEPFGAHWEGRPYLDRVIIQPAKYLKTMLLSMRQGNLHLSEGVTSRELLWVRGDSEIKMKKTAANSIKFIVFHTQKPPLNDIRIRRALQDVLNRKGLVNWLWQDNALPTNSPVPPSNWAYKAVDIPVQNLEKAKELLNEVITEPLSLKVVMLQTRDTAWERFFESFSAACSQVNVQLNVKTLKGKDYLQAMKTGDYDLIWMGWSGDHADPDNFVYPLLHSINAYPGSFSNLSYYSNPVMDELIEHAQRETVMEKRQQLYYKIQEILVEEVPWIPILVPQNIYLYHHSVQDVSVTVTGRVKLEKIWIEK
ncbi:MAG: hypothetical protein HQM12_11350 [SAR324 cluster bacterium]|nr:hypothetical protein [SAR324 cluster bacterium]